MKSVNPCRADWAAAAREDMVRGEGGGGACFYGRHRASVGQGRRGGGGEGGCPPPPPLAFVLPLISPRARPSLPPHTSAIPRPAPLHTWPINHTQEKGHTTTKKTSRRPDPISLSPSPPTLHPPACSHAPRRRGRRAQPAPGLAHEQVARLDAGHHHRGQRDPPAHVRGAGGRAQRDEHHLQPPVGGPGPGEGRVRAGGQAAAGGLEGPDVGHHHARLAPGQVAQLDARDGGRVAQGEPGGTAGHAQVAVDAHKAGRVEGGGVALSPPAAAARKAVLGAPGTHHRGRAPAGRAWPDGSHVSDPPPLATTFWPVMMVTPFALRNAAAALPREAGLPASRVSPAVTRVTGLSGKATTTSAAASTPTGPPPTTTTAGAAARAAARFLAPASRSATVPSPDGGATKEGSPYEQPGARTR